MSRQKTFIFLMFGLLFALAASLSCMFFKTEAHAFTEEPAAHATLDDGEGGFDRAQLSRLYGLLKTGATQLSDLDDLAMQPGSNTAGTGASDFSAQDIVVELGQKKWTPVHLTKDQEGHTILTLWLAWTEDLQPWSAFSLDEYRYDETPQTQYDPYPMNMYSSSYLRAYLNGTAYLSAQGEETLVSGNAAQSPDWKTFLATFGDYLDAPEEISYQASERATQILPEYRKNFGNIPNEYDLLNEGYAETGLNYNTEDGFDYRTKAGYTDWKQDKLWLPSLSETGWGEYTNYETVGRVIYFTEGEKLDGGIWNTTWEQCRMGTSQQYDSWLRSGDTKNTYAYRNGDHALALSLTASADANDASGKNYVRPAIHLDLTMAEGVSPDPDASVEKPVGKNLSFEYDGEEHSLFIENYTKMNFSEVPEGATFANGKLTARDAGEYTLTASPKAGTWQGEEGGDPVGITLTITPRHVDVSVRNGFHVAGNQPQALTGFFLGYAGIGYDTFLADEGVEDLKGFTPTLSRNGRIYPLDSALAVGYYEIVAENGVYGNYNATFNFTDESRYVVGPDDTLAISVGGELVINQSVTIPYTGAKPSIAYDNKPSGWRSSSVSYVGSDGVSQTGLPVEVGQYTVTVKTNLRTYPFTLIIEDRGDPAKPDAAALLKKAKYDGNAVELPVANANKLNFQTPTAGSSYEGGVFSAVEAGEYTLTVTPETAWADGTQGSVTYTIVIEKRALVLAPERAGHIYGQAPVTPILSVRSGDGYAKGEDFASLYVSVEFTLTRGGQTYKLDSTLPAGDYTIQAELVEGSEARNYKVTFEAGVYTVSKAAVDMSAVQVCIGDRKVRFSAVEPSYSFQFDGNEHAVTIEALPAVLTANIRITQAGAELQNAPSAVGTYLVEVTFTLKDADNYEPVQAVTFNLVISDKTYTPITLTVGNAGHLYGQQPTLTVLALTLKEGSFNEGDGIQTLGRIEPVLKSQDGTVRTLDKNLAAGSYILTAQDGVYGDYQVRFEAGVYTVSKATVDTSKLILRVGGQTFSGGSVSFVFDGTEKGVTLEGSLPDYVSYTIEYYRGDDKLEAAPKEEGSYRAVVKFTLTNSNFEPIDNIEIAITITPEDAPAPVYPAKPSKTTLKETYDGTEKYITIADFDKVTVSSLSAGATCKEGKFAATNAGTYVVTLSPVGGKWADGTTASVTLAIQIAKATLDMGATKFVIGGKEVAYSALEAAYSFEFDDAAKTVEVYGLPASVTAKVSFTKNGAQLPAAPSAAGTYSVGISFILTDAANYNAVPACGFTLEIVETSSSGDPSDDPTDTPTDDPSDTPSNPSAPTTIHHEFPVWGYVVIGLSVVLCAAISIVLIVRTKKH